MADPMPEHIVPMYARLSRLPPDDTNWGYEIKWDGVRAIAYVDRGEVRLESRNLNDVTSQYPEVAPLAEALGARAAVLDGEIVAFDENGRPSFERLQGRMHVADPALIERRVRLLPVVYVAFDLLWIDGESLMQRPYPERRARLEKLALTHPSIRVPGYHAGEGQALLQAATEQGLEGVIAKRLDSSYEPGRRGGAWLKVKVTRRQELVIGGWVPGEGRRRDRIGALLVGYHDDAASPALSYAGKVGTGFDDRELLRLSKLLSPLERATSPFEGKQPERGAIFVEPELVAEVEFTEWTSQRMLRHPSYKGLRDDKPAREVVFESVA